MSEMEMNCCAASVSVCADAPAADDTNATTIRTHRHIAFLLMVTGGVYSAVGHDRVVPNPVGRGKPNGDRITAGLGHGRVGPNPGRSDCDPLIDVGSPCSPAHGGSARHGRALRGAGHTSSRSCGRATSA